MRQQVVDAPVEVGPLFTALVAELHNAGYFVSLGSEDPSAPYVQILSRPERRELVSRLNPQVRTTVRLYLYDAYLDYLARSFPRLLERFEIATRRGRPFLVIEEWIPYIDLGRRLLDFAREHDLNLRCLNHGRMESRLNGLRVYYDRVSQEWRVTDQSVDEILRDPRSRSRSWLERRNPWWSMGRAWKKFSAATLKKAPPPER
jgi:hypothetical protein